LVVQKVTRYLLTVKSSSDDSMRRQPSAMKIGRPLKKLGFWTSQLPEL
jgi:hypothetical protein